MDKNRKASTQSLLSLIKNRKLRWRRLTTLKKKDTITRLLRLLAGIIKNPGPSFSTTCFLPDLQEAFSGQTSREKTKTTFMSHNASIDRKRCSAGAMR
ncbi:MAG: hypothetical protein MI742_13050 [Desulfobacterales bacterium]|nr:hypothetical protein [Desulfobacterales bacterium]